MKEVWDRARRSGQNSRKGRSDSPNPKRDSPAGPKYSAQTENLLSIVPHADSD
jgi:hypothetical protein